MRNNPALTSLHIEATDLPSYILHPLLLAFPPSLASFCCVRSELQLDAYKTLGDLFPSNGTELALAAIYGDFDVSSLLWSRPINLVGLFFADIRFRADTIQKLAEVIPPNLTNLRIIECK